MSNLMYGRYHWGRYRWTDGIKQNVGPVPPPERTQYLPNVFSVIAYAKDGTKTAIFGAGSESNSLSSLTFELTETGCGTCTMKFTQLPTNAELSYRQRVDIHLFNDTQPWWSGYIMSRPVDGTSAGASGKTFEFKAFGYYNLLERVLVTATYQNMEVSAIVRQIAQLVEQKVGLQMNSNKIVNTLYNVSKIEFDHTSVKDCLKQLAEFAVDYVYGVDENRNLYFRPRNNEINEQARFWVGEHLSSFEPTMDAEKVENHIFVKGGKLDTSGSQWLAEVQDNTSIDTYGWCEKTVDLPSAYGTADAQRYALIYLENHKNPVESAKVTGVQLEYDEANGAFSVRKLSTQGKAYIVDRNGTAHTMPITKLKYTISADKGISCDMTLGNPPEAVDKVLARLQQNYANQQALQAAANKQLV